MPATMRGLALALLTVAASAACSDVTFEGGGPLTLTLTADRTSASVDQAVTFDFEVVGSVLVGVIITYGDGDSDTTDTFGAQTANGRFIHAFAEGGSFTVVGTVFDNVQGSAADTVVVQVGGGE